MGISGLVSETVIDKDLISVTEELELDADHNSISGCIDRIARLQCKVNSCMSLGSSCERVASEAETAGETIYLLIRYNRRDGRYT